MILSVSRRTDIPAFYLEDFIRRLKGGKLCLINPYNTKQKRVLEFGKKDIDCIVFWTRDPAKLLRYEKDLSGYFYYVMVTLTGYGKELEKRAAKPSIIISSFKEISKALGKERVIWRYDPILFSGNIGIEYHRNNFFKIARGLSGYTGRCIISFLDIYKKKAKRLKALGIKRPDDEEIKKISRDISKIASSFGIELQTCSEKIDLSDYGIEKGSCIDRDLINKYVKRPILAEKDKNQRKYCMCAKSIDIGVYDTCLHGCVYCYACR